MAVSGLERMARWRFRGVAHFEEALRSRMPKEIEKSAMAEAVLRCCKAYPGA